MYIPPLIPRTPQFMNYTKLRVSQLIDVLSKQDQDAIVQVTVSWSGDTAIGDLEAGLTVEATDDGVQIGGWLPNCGTELTTGE